MAAQAPIYDLTLMLDPEAEEAARTRALSDTQTSIEAHGQLVRHDDWGERPLAYPIKKRKSAEYHLLQFHTEDRDLLSGLERTLHITDGVLRFRLIKLRPGTPAPPDMRAPAARRTGEEEGERAPRRRPPEAPAAPVEAQDAVAEEPSAEAPVPAEAEPASAEQPAS